MVRKITTPWYVTMNPDNKRRLEILTHRSLLSTCHVRVRTLRIHRKVTYLMSSSRRYYPGQAKACEEQLTVDVTFILSSYHVNSHVTTTETGLNKTVMLPRMFPRTEPVQKTNAMTHSVYRVFPLIPGNEETDRYPLISTL